MEFQVAIYETNGEANALMQGPGFAVHPMGVGFDPEEWLARLRSGEPEANFYQ